MSKANEPVTGYLDIPLTTPLSIDGVAVKAMRMREPTVADQLAMDEVKGSESVKELNVFANLCLVSPDDLKKLTMRDYKKLQTAFMSFID